MVDPGRLHPVPLEPPEMLGRLYAGTRGRASGHRLEAGNPLGFHWKSIRSTLKSIEIQ